MHDGNPALTAHVTAAAVRPGERGFTLSKGKSKRKIDACSAMTIALWRVAGPVETRTLVVPWAMWA